ncbi:MAG: plasmid pRiA4b ORF-3 family protein [Alphaproteobacteria bacterium]
MAAKSKNQPVIYQLKVTIENIRPPVWRRLQVPGDITLGSLHDVLQTAFGWTDSHLHQFVIGDTYFAVPDPEDAGWGPRARDERRARLTDVIRRGAKRFVYEYDFGDGWEHEIIVEEILAPETGTAYPRCLVGRRACPPEDCGGPWGYAELLETIRNPQHPDHVEMRDWVGEEFDPEHFDLDAVNAQLKPQARGHR